MNLIYKAARFSGPTHHHVQVTFVDGDGAGDIYPFPRFAQFQVGGHEKAVRGALADISAALPLHGRFGVDVIHIDPRDRAVPSLYARLFQTILEDARRGLPRG
ncbi:MAG: hypothetical protein AAGF32_06765 [Pseudomonadota bacterium]